MVLNRIGKGAREINIAATLEHIRDQRAKMVKTKVIIMKGNIPFRFFLGTIRIRLRGCCRRSDQSPESLVSINTNSIRFSFSFSDIHIE